MMRNRATLGGGSMLNMVSPINWLHPLNRGLVAKWTCVPGLMGGSRLINLTQAGDKDGNHGTLNGALSWSGGRQQFAAISGFAGGEPTTTYVDCGNSATLNPSSGATYAAWYKPSSLATHAMLVGRDDETDGRSYNIYLNTSGDAALQINGAATATTSSVVAPAGYWHLLLARGDAANGWEVRIWQGQMGRWFSATAAWSAPASSTTSTCIGRRSYNTSNLGAVGTIGPVAIWSRRLADADVTGWLDATRQDNDPTLNWISRRTYFGVQAAADGGGPPMPPPILPGGGIAEIAWPAWQQSFRFQ